MRTFVALLGVLLLTVGCARSKQQVKKPSAPPPEPKAQEVLLAKSQLSAEGEVHQVESTMHPGEMMEVRILPAGCTPRDSYDVVLPPPEAGKTVYDADVPCKICGGPVKFKIRRPQPAAPSTPPPSEPANPAPYGPSNPESPQAPDAPK